MKLYLLKIIVVFLSFSLIACFKKKQKDSLPIKDTFRFNILTEPPTLDWNKARDTTSSLIVDNIMDGLLDYDFTKTGPIKLSTLRPALATKWSATKDNKIWTFNIRKGVRWGDGELFKAEHVRDGWERLLNPLTASEYAYFLYSIKNARAYNEGKIKDFSKVGVTITQKGNLVVELEKGKSYFPYLLTHTSTYPIRKDIIKKYGEDHWTRPESIVTLGAYKLKKWEHDKKIILEANENYYSLPANIKNILLYIISESGTALNLFEQGHLDAIANLSSRELPVLSKRKEYRSTPIISTYYYGLNVDREPFTSVKVRKAFNRAIDRKEITDLLKGGQLPLRSWIPKGIAGYDPNIGLRFNPEKARKLLDEAGYKDRNSFPKVTLSYNTHEDHKRIAEKVQAQLKKHLNIRVELSNEEWKTYLQTLTTGKQHMYRMGWVADFPDPDNFMTLMTSYSDNNHTHWNSTRYDKLVEKAAVSSLESERLNLYHQAQKILGEEEVPVIPIYSGQSHWLISNRVAVFPLNGIGKILFKQIKFH